MHLPLDGAQLLELLLTGVHVVGPIGMNMMHAAIDCADNKADIHSPGRADHMPVALLGP
jgi:hypothetical protein